jgi:aspartyl-tRNA(Asn)/glutamyl-tRNA(Gln) amidotransferase subunit A
LKSFARIGKIAMDSRRTFIGSIGAGAFVSADTTGPDPCWLSIEQAAAALRRRTMSPVDLTQACLARIEKLNPRLNCYITVMSEEAVSAARTAEADLRSGKDRGMLHGIPVALKDLIDTAGTKTTAGSQQYASRVPSEDAEVVRKLKRAGAIILGKLNMDEFAYNYTADTSFFGLSRNPWDTTRSPGGSSGGSAIAVAAGTCFAALGSDTGGSIRLPAALCGITGLKPTYGRVSTRGAAPLAWSLDHIGPMTRSARDAGWVLSAIAESTTRHAAALHAPLPKASALFQTRAKSIRIGVPRAMYWDGVDTEVRNAVTSALKLLAGIVKSIRDLELPRIAVHPALPDLLLPYTRIITAEAYAFHAGMLKQHPDRYHAGTRESIKNGAGVKTTEYIAAVQEMERLRDTSGSLFRDVDLLVTPAAPAPAFRFGERAGLIFLRNLAPWNLYGLPSVSIPCGFNPRGLPTGLQIVGPAGREDLVLSLAAEYQSTTNWHERRPQV